MSVQALLEVLEIRIKTAQGNPTEQFFLNELRLKLMQLQETEYRDPSVPDDWVD